MCIFTAYAAINDINRPKDGETGRYKRVKLSLDPRENSDGPSFLKPHGPENVLSDDVDPLAEGSVYRPK